MAGILGEGPRGRPLHDIGLGELLLHALQRRIDAVHLHAEMIEPADIAIAQGIDVEPHIAIAYGDPIGRTADLARGLQPEHGLVELGHHGPVGAVHGHVVDLREHQLWSSPREVLIGEHLMRGRAMRRGLEPS